MPLRRQREQAKVLTPVRLWPTFDSMATTTLYFVNGVISKHIFRWNEPVFVNNDGFQENKGLAEGIEDELMEKNMSILVGGAFAKLRTVTFEWRSPY